MSKLIKCSMLLTCYFSKVPWIIHLSTTAALWIVVV